MWLLFTTLCWAQLERMPGFPERGGLPKPVSNASASYTHQPVSRLNGSLGDLGTELYQVHGRAPIWSSDDNSSLSFLGYSFEHRQNTGTGQLSSGEQIPKQLVSPTISGTWSKFKTLRDSEGVSIALGSPSDRPFHTFAEASVSANYIRRWGARDERDSWFFAFNYSNVRPFLNNIPIPGFGYEWHTDSWTWLLGVPFIGGFGSPWKKGVMNLTLFPPFQVMASVTQFILGPLQVFAQFTSRDHNYILAQRGLAHDRYVISEKIVAVGLRSPISKILTAQMEYGKYMGQVHRQQIDAFDSTKGPRAHTPAPEDQISLSLRSTF